MVLGDITDMDVEAIVAPANPSLRGGGGADGAIHRAAGPRLADAGGRIAPCATGDAKPTPGFCLDPPVRYVVHTVGPVWHGGTHGEAALLASCYRRSLEVADGLGVRSIAFPAISTGIYGYPAGEAAAVAVSTLTSAPTSVERIVLVAFDAASFSLLSAELSSTRSPRTEPADG